MKLFDIMIVGFGGGFGAISRFAIAWGCQRFLSLSAPIGTLVANVTGCFLIGLLIGSGKAEQSDTEVVKTFEQLGESKLLTSSATKFIGFAKCQ